MKSLCSNGPGSVGDWKGSDTTLEYPAVDTCVTVTCHVNNTLIGCHLFHSWTLSFLAGQLEKSIAEFAIDAKKLGPVKAIYIVGNISHWEPQIATLTTLLREKLGYVGGIGSSDPRDCVGNIVVTLEGPVAIVFTNNGQSVRLTLLDE